jgi:hypothetical protein
VGLLYQIVAKKVLYIISAYCPLSPLKHKSVLNHISTF